MRSSLVLAFLFGLQSVTPFAPLRTPALRPTRECKRGAGFEFPDFSKFLSAPSSPRKAENSATVGAGDRVAIIGASGNVGRLVALRLADLGVAKVRAVARDAERCRGFFDGIADAAAIEVVEADTTKPETLGPALAECDAVVVVTGTTAFPTLAWRGGNTPKRVDEEGVLNVLEAWRASPARKGGAKKRCILMSSIGVDRRGDFPFSILNACGVLDAKASSEEALRAAAAQQSDDKWLGSFAIVRPGQLIGGPYDNNYYLGTLAKLDKPARSVLLWDDSPKGDVLLAKGDTLLGDTLRSTVAEVLVSALLAPGGECAEDIAVVNVDGERPSEAELQRKMDALL